MGSTFRALLVEETATGVQAGFRDIPAGVLPEGDVLISVAYSSLNYKDGLAVTGKGKVIRSYPMVPGIDLAGTVRESQSPRFRPGDAVILTGWGIGERHWGGYAQLARVRSEWLVPLPEGLSLEQAMGIGTAGLTAMLCVMALEERGLVPGEREVAVTGAAGGVGSYAVALLARLGYRVVAVTGRPGEHEYLTALGASRILDRATLLASPDRPLESEHWGGAVDTVGGQPLAILLRQMAYGSSVAACGLAAGASLTTTVFPFVLRGVNLIGIDSVYCPTERRAAAWQRLAAILTREVLERICRVEPLSRVGNLAEAILRGQIRGRVILDVNA